MAHRAHPDFWYHYRQLPGDIQELADRCFELLAHDAHHPSLHLKKVGTFWSVRVGRSYRALSIEVDDGLLWTWIGAHDDYERLIAGI